MMILPPNQNKSSHGDHGEGGDEGRCGATISEIILHLAGGLRSLSCSNCYDWFALVVLF
jgi:hypothetical protein